MKALAAHCATWARAVGLRPAGTAPRCDVFVLVEHPLPWPSDIADCPELAALQRVAAESAPSGRAVRVQAITCGAGSGRRRVVVFAAGDPPFAGYGRSEGVAAVEDLPQLVAELVAADPPPLTAGVTDVLVCTHGSRDACCGSFGTRLWAEGIDGVRLWRTSHTGGHRFAPRAITFPDGSYWAYLDRQVLQGIVERSIPAALAAEHLRGCAAFEPAVQVADGAALAERGWGWLSAARFGEQRSAQRVELCFESADGERGCYDVVVEEQRRMPVPDCGADPYASSKHQAEFRVASIRYWS